MSVTSQGNARTLLLGGFIKSKVDLLQFVSHKNTVGGNWEARGNYGKWFKRDGDSSNSTVKSCYNCRIFGPNLPLPGGLRRGYKHVQINKTAELLTVKTRGHVFSCSISCDAYDAGPQKLLKHYQR